MYYPSVIQQSFACSKGFKYCKDHEITITDENATKKKRMNE